MASTNDTAEIAQASNDAKQPETETTEEEEDLEKLQAEIAKMEEEAARIAAETASLKNEKAEGNKGSASNSNVQDSSSSGAAGTSSDGAASGKDGAGTDTESRDKLSIYVGQVDYSSTPEELMQHFEPCGGVERVTIVCDKFTGQPKGFAYLEFQTEEAVENAVKLDGSTFKGRTLKVTHKRVNDPNYFIQQGGGRGGRGGRGFRGGWRGGRGGGRRGGRRGGYRGGGGYGYHPYY